MNRQDLKSKFSISGTNSDLRLYRIGEFTYCGSVSLKRGKVWFNEKSYSDVESLDKALLEYAKTLPYPIATYNPSLNEFCRVEDQLSYILTNKFKFCKSSEIGAGYYGQFYVRKIGPNIGLRVGIRNTDIGIDLSLKYGKYTFEKTVTTTEDGLAYINSMINTVVSLSAIDMVSLISKCSGNISSDIDAFVDSNTSTLGFERVDFKTLMISTLEEQLKALKG